MKNNYNLKIFSLMIFLIVSLSSCSSGGWFGSDDDDEKLVGKRIDAIAVKKSLSIDKDATNININFYDGVLNNSYSKSEGYNYLGNLKLENFNKESIKIDIGYINKNYHAPVSPIIGDNKIFTLDSEGLVRAFDLANPKIRIWEYEIKLDKSDDSSFLNAGMTYDNRELYITSGSLKVLALNTDDGSLLWSRNLASTASSAPEFMDNMLYVVTNDNHLYSLNRLDGGILWDHAGIASEVATLGMPSPALYKGVIIVSYSSGEIFALDAYSGNVLWGDNLSLNSKQKFSLTDLDASPIIYKNNVIAVSNAGLLSSYDIKTGSKIWEKEVAASKTPWQVEDFLYIIDKNSKLICIYLPTGSIKFVKQLDRYEDKEEQIGEILWQAPIVANSKVWLVNNQGELLSLSVNDGTVIDKIEVADDIYLPPVIAGGKMFLLSDSGDLVVM